MDKIKTSLDTVNQAYHDVSRTPGEQQNEDLARLRIASEALLSSVRNAQPPPTAWVFFQDRASAYPPTMDKWPHPMAHAVPIQDDTSFTTVPDGGVCFYVIFATTVRIESSHIKVAVWRQMRAKLPNTKFIMIVVKAGTRSVSPGADPTITIDAIKYDVVSIWLTVSAKAFEAIDENINSITRLKELVASAKPVTPK